MKKELAKRVNNYFNDFINLFPSRNPKPKEKYISSPTRIKALEIAFKKKGDEKKGSQMKKILVVDSYPK